MFIRGSRAGFRGVSTYGDVIFQLLLAAFGLHAGTTPWTWLRRVVSALGLASLIFVPFGSPYAIYEREFGNHTTSASLSDTVVELGLISFTVVTIYSTFLLRRRGETIEPLLQCGGRPFSSVIVFLLYISQILIMDTIFIADHESSLRILQELGFARMDLVFVIIAMIYHDAVQALVVRLRQLRRVSRQPVINWMNLVSEKWKIRDRIDVINSLFSGLLASFYLHVFLSATFLWAGGINNFASYSRVCLLSMNFCCFTSALFMLARKASAVRSECETTEATLMRRLQEECLDLDLTPMEHLRFREDFDSLRVGCFGHHQANFLRFSSVVVTSIAVVLQFDYVVIRTLNTLSNQVESGNWKNNTNITGL